MWVAFEKINATLAQVRSKRLSNIGEVEILNSRLDTLESHQEERCVGHILLFVGVPEQC